MTGAVDGLGALDGVSLGELDASVALRERVERKYVVEPAVVGGLVAALQARLGTGLRVLDVEGRRAFEYRSLYYDTTDLLSYRLSVHGHRRRFKVRSRLYVDSGTSVLEVKVKDGRGLTQKHRLARAGAAWDAPLEPGVIEWIDALVGCRAVPTPLDLRPVIVTAYTRRTLVEGAGARVTIDSGLACGPVGADLGALREVIVVETKSSGPSGGWGTSTVTDRELWRRGVRPVRISKFGVAMALCTPALPANRWNRVLRHHLGWNPARGPSVAAPG